MGKIDDAMENARANNNFMHLSHTLVLSSYRFSFNDTLPSSMVMNGCIVCFRRKGNNELLLSMQFIETCYPIKLPEELHRWLNFKNCDAFRMLSLFHSGQIFVV